VLSERKPKKICV